MNRKHLVRMFRCGALVALWLPCLYISRADMPTARSRYLLTDQEAILVDRLEVVAGANVRAADWSPDGKAALVLREIARNDPAAAPEIHLIEWNASTRRASTLWKGSFALEEGRAPAIAWLPNSSTAILTLRWSEGGNAAGGAERPPRAVPSRQGYLWADLARGRVREIAGHLGESLVVSAMHPAAILAKEDLNPDGKTEKATVRLIDKDGMVGRTYTFPQAPGVWQWGEDSKTLFAHTYIRLAAEKRPTEKWSMLNLSTGELAPIEQRPRLAAEVARGLAERKRSLRIRQANSTLKESETAQIVHPIWLESGAKTKPPRLLLTADGDWAKLSPRENGVLYQAQGAVYVAPLLRLPKDQFVTAMKTAIMKNAKMVGTGLAMYCQDYDEFFPPGDLNVAEVVDPYVKDSSVFDGFGYIDPGKGLGDIGDPKETVIGTIGGPGGRANVYADGHVQWIDD